MPMGREPGSAMSETLLQLQGLKCPLPALRTRKALEAARSGEHVVVECTDPLAAIDIPLLVQQTGDFLEASERQGAVLSFRIRKA
jgi:tRNA 2-thiouridine synthesizing protein A